MTANTCASPEGVTVAAMIVISQSRSDGARSIVLLTLCIRLCGHHGIVGAICISVFSAQKFSIMQVWPYLCISDMKNS